MPFLSEPAVNVLQGSMFVSAMSCAVAQAWLCVDVVMPVWSQHLMGVLTVQLAAKEVAALIA